ncbi:ATP-binding protein [Actinosynnema sp. NPDC053489]|uniref:ATP-binding protein n=1 Tax=Actinosynnema sp. NPDC053489 TaxID=3363916 RepID=UPI0037C92184
MRQEHGCLVVRPTGVLDAGTYASLRDTLLKCAVEQPRAVVVDLADVEVRAESLLSVFAAVWLRTCDWPGVPLKLAGAPGHVPPHTALRRYVAVHDTVPDALDRVDEPPPSRLARRDLPHDLDSPGAARAFASRTCRDWRLPEDVVDAAVQVVSELVTNTVLHTSSAARVRLELRRGLLTVAVGDDDSRPAVLRERLGRRDGGLGLLVVAQLAKTWGCVPDRGNGRKVVWAVLGTAPERLSA